MNSLSTSIAVSVAWMILVVPSDSSAQSLNVIGTETQGGIHLAMVHQLTPDGNTSFVNEGPSIAALPAGPNPGSLAPVITGNAGSGIVYTCDATINAVAGVCNFLNTTIAALYSGTFANASVSIYITFGSTGLGQSRTSLGTINYTTFRNALVTAQADANDATAIANSVPTANPFGTDPVAVTNANLRALGFNPTFGLTPAGSSCNLTSAGCYDAIITISSALQASGGLYFRSGTITSGQYDFYSVVEHESDETLGTGSCGFGGCNFSGTIYVAPADLFRYHSNGAHSLVAGTNSSCASSDATNACFSLDGVHMLQQYNNLNNGQDPGDWAPNCATPRVQNAASCSGVANLNISSTAEILVLDVIGYTLGSASSRVGIFRSGFFWLQDVDGNQQFNSPPDKAFAFGGVPGDIPITGDWNGSGTTKVGIYRPSNGLFVLDYDGDGQLTAADKVYNLGVGIQAGDVPVVGDWNGDGKTKVGLFRAGFFWILDTNGNGVFQQGIDQTFAFGGVAGDVPVVGDWSGTGTSKIGLFRQGFFWILDYNGNGILDNVNQAGGDQAFSFGGIAGDVPIVGDWNGDGRGKVGVFRGGYFWVLDANGNHTFDGTATGQDLAFPFGGVLGDKPVVGKS